jgi:hypothetical protein
LAPNQFIGLEAAKGCTGFSMFVLVDPLSLVDPFVLTYLPVSVGLPLSDGPANAINLARHQHGPKPPSHAVCQSNSNNHPGACFKHTR